MERVTLAQCPNCHAVSRTDEHVHKAGCAIQHQAEERTAVWLDEVVAMVEGAASEQRDLERESDRRCNIEVACEHQVAAESLESLAAQLKGTP